MTRRTLLVVACGAVIVAISMGVRQAFGVFLLPISSDLQLGREVFGLTLALQNLLFGLFSPFIGVAADRFGAARVIVLCTLLYAGGLLLATLSTQPIELYLTLGLLVGVGLSGTTYVVVLGAVARAVPAPQRSRAFGITTAVGSFGMFAIIPGAQALLTYFGWIDTFYLIATGVAVMALFAVGLAGRPAASDSTASGPSLPEALRTARRHSGYWLLNAGFFVCGFHVTFIAVHLPAYLRDNALSPEIGAFSLALIGFFNIIGSYWFAALGEHYRKKYLLSVIYLVRAVVIALFLAFPVTSASALIFSAAIGFLWLATVPLTSGVVAQIFGTRYLSTLYGVVFLSHQVGSFLGAWLGGYAYDIFGSYDLVWTVSIALGVAAALIHWPIADAPAPRLIGAKP